MKEEVEDSVFIKCSCQGEGMGVDFEKEDNLFYFSYWSAGLTNKKLSIKERLRYSLHCLFTGKAFNDELVFTIDDAKKLNLFLSGRTRKVSGEIAQAIKGKSNE